MLMCAKLDNFFLIFYSMLLLVYHNVPFFFSERDIWAFSIIFLSGITKLTMLLKNPCMCFLVYICKTSVRTYTPRRVEEFWVLDYMHLQFF